MSGPTMTRSDLGRMIVAPWMTNGVIRCAPHTPLAVVAELMVEWRVHCVVVAAEEARDGVWGIVSDLDLVAAAGVRDLDEQTAGGSAATPALVISPSETLERAAQLMTEHAATHLVVVEGSEPIGVLSTLDVARALVDG